MVELARKTIAARTRRRLPLRWQQAMWAYVFLAVPLAFFLYIRIWPALQAFNLSVREWNIVGEARWGWAWRFCWSGSSGFANCSVPSTSSLT